MVGPLFIFVFETNQDIWQKFLQTKRKYSNLSIIENKNTTYTMEIESYFIQLYKTTVI
jgi:hypothetical protein